MLSGEGGTTHWAMTRVPPAFRLDDVGGQGMSNQIPTEDGWAVPGVFYVAFDTQGATMGALNCYAMPALEAAPAAMATGDIWLTVPESIRITLRGRLPRGILGKDIYFRLMQDLGIEASGRVLELGGPGLPTLPID